MKALGAVITLGIAGLVLTGAIILGSSEPRSAPSTASSTNATPASACTSSSPTTGSAAEPAVTPGMPAAALRHQGNSLTPMRAAVVPTPPAGCTAGGTAWDPGNIISDSVFYNSSSMTTDQIRDFIATRARTAPPPGA